MVFTSLPPSAYKNKSTHLMLCSQIFPLGDHDKLIIVILYLPRHNYVIFFTTPSRKRSIDHGDPAMRTGCSETVSARDVGGRPTPELWHEPR
jgi:hypothetical protein